MRDPSTICFRCENNERHQAKREGRALAGPCKCLISGQDIDDHQQARDCPKGFFDGATPLVQVSPRAEGRKVARAEIIKTVGPKIWKELHDYAARIGDTNGAQDFLSAWAGKLPCGECKTEWRSILQDSPPVMATPYLFFLWTVKVHNRINAKLGKPEMTADEAVALYHGGTV